MGCFGNRSLVPGADRVFVLAAGRTAESSDPHWTDTRSTAGTARGLIMLFVVFPLLCRAYAAPARAVAVACRDALSLTAMLQCHCPRQIRKKPMHVRTHDARRTTHDARHTKRARLRVPAFIRTTAARTQTQGGTSPGPTTATWRSAAEPSVPRAQKLDRFLAVVLFSNNTRAVHKSSIVEQWRLCCFLYRQLPLGKRTAAGYPQVAHHPLPASSEMLPIQIPTCCCHASRFLLEKLCTASSS